MDELTGFLQYHALSKDIRKTPINYPRKGSVSKPFAASAAPSSTSTVVGVGEQTDALDSSGTLVTFSNQSTENLPSTFSKKPKSWSRGKYSPHRTTENSWLGGERYWSEFNDEDEEDEPYTILVSPDPPSDYGQPHGVMAWMMEKLKNFFSFTEESHIGERQHLLPDMADSSDEDLEDGVTGRALNYGYSTFSAQNQDTQMRIRESILYRGYCLSFLASTAILSISGAWVVSGSSKKHASDLRTGLAEALCVFASVVLAGYAASLFVARKDNVSLLHKSTVYGLFCAICLGGSFMLSIVYNNCLRP